MAAEFPQTYRWLVDNREQLEDRTGDWTNRDWFDYSRRQNLEKYDSPSGKILVPYMLRDLCASWDDECHFFVNVATGGYGIEVAHSAIEDPRYVAALLNSHLLSYLLRLYAGDFRGGWVDARKRHLERLPIVIPAASKQHEIVQMYEQCKRSVASLRETRTGSRDRNRRLRIAASQVDEFDHAVNDLYGLTPDERALIAQHPPGPLA